MNLVAMILSVAISCDTVILSPQIGNFMKLPQWMPNEVSVDDTFGSRDRIPASHRITTNTLAAVESIFEAYYERLYFQSAAGDTDTLWSTNSYGPRDWKEMTFDEAEVNYSDGNRTVPNTRRLVEFDELLKFSGGDAFGQLIDTIEPIDLKDSWGTINKKKTVYMSSSIIPGSGRPVEYAWRDDVASNYNFGACLPLYACKCDNTMHTDSSYRNYVHNYPVPQMFFRADFGYYQNRVYPTIGNLKVDKTISELMVADFPNSDTESGLLDTSRRLKPDDVVTESSTNSSLLASVSRGLAVMDRTYEFPYYDATQGTVDSRHIDADRKLTIAMRGVVSVNEIEIDSTLDGFFTCNEFTDEDMSVLWRSNDVSEVESWTTVNGAGRVRARFSGTTSSVYPLDFGMSYVAEGSTVGYMTTYGRAEGPYDEDGKGTHVANVIVSYDQFSKQLYVDIWHNYGRGSCSSTGYTSIPRTLNLEYETRVIVRRMADSDATPHLIDDHEIVSMLPFPTPCNSAFVIPRRADSYSDFLMLVCRKVYDASSAMPEVSENVTYQHNPPSYVKSQLVRTSIKDWKINSINGLRQNYGLAYYNTGAQVKIAMDQLVNGWDDPKTLCNYNFPNA